MLEKSYPLAFQAAIDMFSRLKENHAIVAQLIRREDPIAALSVIAANLEEFASFPVEELLGLAVKLGDDSIFYSVFYILKNLYSTWIKTPQELENNKLMLTFEEMYPEFTNTFKTRFPSRSG